MDSKGEVFMSLVAQEDNLGDLVIRRQVLQYAAATGARIHLLAAGMPKGFIEPFGLSDQEILYWSKSTFTRSMIRQAFRRRVTLILSPGPEHLAPGWKGWLQILGQIGRTLFLRCFGGRIVALGRSVLGVKSKWRILAARLSARLTNVYFARDHASVAALRSPVVKFAPDVAFDLQVSPSVVPVTRPLAALSFRREGGPRVDDLKHLVEELESRGLQPILVSQVRRDDSVHAELAAAAGCDAVLWGAHSHGDQLDRVHEIYSRSKVVVSNRLHALIFGAVNGASPLPYGGNDMSKPLATVGPVLSVRAIQSDMSDLVAALDGCLDPAVSEQQVAQLRIGKGLVRSASAVVFSKSGR